MAETFCDSGLVKLKAGINATTLTPAQYTSLINQAEDALNVAAKIPDYNLITNYTALSADVKKILEDGASSHAALGAINWDVDAIGRGTASLMVNINWAIYADTVKLIRDKKFTDWMREQ